MKKLSVYIFLILFSFQAPSLADDITDFQIEGMSIGDSLLDYFSEKEIKKNKRKYKFKNKKKFYAIGFDFLKSFKDFKVLDIYVKTNDKNYEISGIIGVIPYKNNIMECEKKKDEMVAEISSLFQNVKKKDEGTYKHEFDKSGKSTRTAFFFYFNSGDDISVQCMNWSKKIERKHRWYDHFRVNVVSKELRYWRDNEAF